MKQKVIISGSTGFIGSFLYINYSDQFELEALSMRSYYDPCILQNTTAIIYSTGIAHQTKKIPDELYIDINATKAVDLAKKAKAAHIKQFIYLSSAKVYGEVGHHDIMDICNPQGIYGQSKQIAEEQLMELRDEHFKVYILRIPLVYGPNVKGNLLSLIKFASQYNFLPLGNINNRRSMLFIGNLSACILHIIMKNSQDGIMNVTDREAISTSTLARHMLNALGSNKKLIRIPLFLQKTISWIKPSLSNKLFGDFILQSKGTYDKIAFEPPFTSASGINEMCKFHLDEH